MHKCLNNYFVHLRYWSCYQTCIIIQKRFPLKIEREKHTEIYVVLIICFWMHCLSFMKIILNRCCEFGIWFSHFRGNFNGPETDFIFPLLEGAWITLSPSMFGKLFGPACGSVQDLVFSSIGTTNFANQVMFCSLWSRHGDFLDELSQLVSPTVPSFIPLYHKATWKLYARIKKRLFTNRIGSFSFKQLPLVQ